MKANRILLLVRAAVAAVYDRRGIGQSEGIVRQPVSRLASAWRHLTGGQRPPLQASRPARTRREIFVLTSEEKRTVYFVLFAFVLGLATKFYRDAHPRLLPKPDIKVRGHPSPHRPK